MFVRAFISGVQISHELDSDRKLAVQAVESLGPHFTAFAFKPFSPDGYRRDPNEVAPESCNFLILLLARTITPVVKKEFQYAKALGMPCLVFLRQEDTISAELANFLSNIDCRARKYSTQVELFHGIRDTLSEFGAASRETSIVDLHIRDVWTNLVKRLYVSPNDVYELPWRKFEELIAELFSQLDYEVKLTPKGSDGGFDIVARRAIDPLFPSEYLVEAKLWTPPRNVGRPVIQSLYGVGMARNCNGVMLITTSGYTAPGLEFIEEHNLKSFIRLLDGTDMPKLYQRYLEEVGWLEVGEDDGVGRGK